MLEELQILARGELLEHRAVSGGHLARARRREQPVCGDRGHREPFDDLGESGIGVTEADEVGARHRFAEPVAAGDREHACAFEVVAGVLVAAAPELTFAQVELGAAAVGGQ